MIRINNWFTVGDISKTDAHVKLWGIVYGHPRYADGTYVVTSAVQEINGKNVITKSGNHYVLGQPDSSYIELLNHLGMKYDSEDPLHILKQ